MKKNVKLDWSPIIIEICKALELECLARPPCPTRMVDGEQIPHHEVRVTCELTVPKRRGASSASMAGSIAVGRPSFSSALP